MHACMQAGRQYPPVKKILSIIVITTFSRGRNLRNILQGSEWAQLSLTIACYPIISLLSTAQFCLWPPSCLRFEYFKIPGYFPYSHDVTMTLLVRWGSTGTSRSADGIYKYVDTILQPILNCLCQCIYIGIVLII